MLNHFLRWFSLIVLFWIALRPSLRAGEYTPVSAEETEIVTRLLAELANIGEVDKLNSKIDYLRALGRGLDYYHVNEEPKKMILHAARNQAPDFFGNENLLPKWTFLRVVKKEGLNMGLVHVNNKNGNAYIELLYEKKEESYWITDIFMLSAALRYSQSLVLETFRNAPDDIIETAGLNPEQIHLIGALYDQSSAESKLKAIEKFRNARLEIQADEIILNRVIALGFEAGDTTVAEYAYQLILAIYPESELFYQSRIQFEMLTFNYAGALKSIELLEEKMQGTDDYILTQKCAILYQVGDMDRALEVCQQAVVSDRKNSSSPQYLMKIYCDKRDWNSALIQVDRFVREFNIPLHTLKKQPAIQELIRTPEFKAYEESIKN